MTRELAFHIPWPPTVNTYWDTITIPIKGTKKRRATVILSKQAKDYRIELLASVRQQKVPQLALTGKLRVYFTAFPPDHRTRDLDNLFKGMQDGLVHAGVLSNDYDIDLLQIERKHVIKGGIMAVRIEEIPGAATETAPLFAPAPAYPFERKRKAA